MSCTRLAVIGAGQLGRIHARLAAQTLGLQLVAIVDPDPIARQAVAEEFGVSAFEHHRQLPGFVDAAILAAPASMHAPIARDLLSAGLHLLIEKPLATSAADAYELMELANRADRVVQVGHVERFNPAWQAMREQSDEPMFIEIQRLAPHAFRANDVGVVLDLMIHDLDLLLQLVDSDLIRVSATGTSLLDGHEDFAQARIEFQNGIVAHLTASRISSASVRHWQLVGAKSVCTVDLQQRHVEILRPADLSGKLIWRSPAMTCDQKSWFRDHLFDTVLSREPLSVPESNPILTELREFVEAIQLRHPVSVDAAAGYRAVALSERILESIHDHGHAWRSVTAPATLRRAG